MKGRGSLIAVLAGLTAFGLMLGCDRIPGKPTEAQRPLLSSQVSNFDELYGRSCAGCHGGDGQLGAARPLRDPLYLALVRRYTLRQIIAQGVPGTTMPAFSNRFGGGLTDKQIDIVIDGMQNRWGRPQAFTNVTLPPYSLEDARAAGAEPGDLERGKTAYTTYCAHCHGPNGGGGEKGGAVVDGAYLALVSDQALRTAVIAGRVDLGMPDWREAVASQPMTSQDIADVVAWLASHRQRLPDRPSGTGQGSESKVIQFSGSAPVRLFPPPETGEGKGGGEGGGKGSKAQGAEGKIEN